MTGQKDTVVEHLKKTISEYKADITEEKIGRVVEISDGIVKAVGLADVGAAEMVEFDNGVRGVVLNLEEGMCGIMVLGEYTDIGEGMTIKALGELMSVPVGDGIIGRVLDPLGNPKDGKGALDSSERYPMERIAPGVMSRKSVHEPLQTGLKSIDTMVPIGRGQRELIIGDRQTGKTTVAIDTILNQKGQDMICVYVSIAQREGKTAQVVETLRNKGALDYTVVVSAPAAASAVMHFLAPYAGAAVAEYFMHQGKDVVVVYDDLSKHAVAYREMSLLLRRPPSREAYPGDVFYLHSRLLERAAKVNEEHGGGSITALPIIETQANDVSAYIPTNVISITDGQIFLQSDLFNKGIRPAINVGISVSRVGGAAQTKIMKKVSGTAKLDLAQYYELEAFSQFASELDEATKAKLTRGRRVVESLKQRQNNPYKLWQEVVVLFAASQGYMDKIEAHEVVEKVAGLFALIESSHQEFIKKIETEKALSDDIEKEMTTIVKNYFQ